MRYFFSIVLLFVVVGCGQQPTTTTSTPSASALQPTARALLLPDAEATLTHRRIILAQERLIRECMAKAGHPGYSVPSDALISEPPHFATEMVMPSDTVTGYGLAADTEAAAPYAPDAAARQALTGDESAVSTVTLPSGVTVGLSTQGCDAQARGHMYGAPEEAARAYLVVQDIQQSALDKAYSDDSTAQARELWESCMKSKGVQTSTPMEVILELRELYARDRPAAVKAEQRYARADQTCDKSSHLRDRIAEVVEREVQNSPHGVEYANEAADLVARAEQAASQVLAR